MFALHDPGTIARVGATFPASPHCLPTTDSVQVLPALTRRSPQIRTLSILWFGRVAVHGNINLLSIDYACRPRL